MELIYLKFGCHDLRLIWNNVHMASTNSKSVYERNYTRKLHIVLCGMDTWHEPDLQILTAKFCSKTVLFYWIISAAEVIRGALRKVRHRIPFKFQEGLLRFSLGCFYLHPGYQCVPFVLLIYGNLVVLLWNFSVPSSSFAFMCFGNRICTQ